jgi:hypothetical protein
VADWATISSLATGGGTLVLALATFGAVRSSNRSARIAEQALQEQRRPLLVQARLDDPPQKIGFSDNHWVRTQGSEAVVDEADGNLYLALSLRNVGAGIAVLQGWHIWPDRRMAADPRLELEQFRVLTRDLYIAPGDVGLWQGALREPAEDLHRQVRDARAKRELFTVDLFYTDQVGGQRTVSRFGVMPMGDDGWMGSVVRHWNIDGPSARDRSD